MIEKINEIKKIIALFLNIDHEKINDNTVIDNSVILGSVKIHIMYGELADNGYKIENYSKIKYFGQLLNRLNLSENKEFENEKFNNENIENSFSKVTQNQEPGMGIDILKINNLPKVDDFRESSFYIDNFSSKEFSYCLTSTNPYRSFAGKFAAKEAIVKANNQFKDKKFKEIEILHDQNGKPVFENFLITISYTDELVVACAYSKENKEEINYLKKDEFEILTDKFKQEIYSSLSNNKYKKIVFLSVLLSLISLISVATLFVLYLLST